MRTLYIRMYVCIMYVIVCKYNCRNLGPRLFIRITSGCKYNQYSNNAICMLYIAIQKYTSQIHQKLINESIGRPRET